MDKFCKNCGAELNEGDKVCGSCGGSVDNTKNIKEFNVYTDDKESQFVKEKMQGNMINSNYRSISGKNKLSSAGDTGSIGWGILGFFIPTVGVILYFLWRKSSPKNAKKCGQGVLSNIILSIVPLLLLSLFI